MHHVHLIHWKGDEAEQRAARLREAGYEVSVTHTDGAGLLRRLRADSPDAVVIDLTRLPSHGREAGRAMRESKASRHIPLVFVEGEPEKVARVKELFPDAAYATWRGVRGAVKRAIARPPKNPIVPQAYMAGYSGTPLPKKLGVKAGATVSLLNTPDGFERTLGELPRGVVLRRNLRGKFDLLLWFVDSLAELEGRIGDIALRTPPCGTWICWPKQSSGLETDVTQNVVRKIGLASGLVDYKICAIDKTWSGLKFAKRK